MPLSKPILLLLPRWDFNQGDVFLSHQLIHSRHIVRSDLLPRRELLFQPAVQPFEDGEFRLGWRDVVTNLHLQVEELLQIGLGYLYAGIELDLYWDPFTLSGGSQLERVRPRQNDRFLRSITRVKSSWNWCGTFIAQIPGEAIHAHG